MGREGGGERKRERKYFTYSVFVTELVSDSVSIVLSSYVSVYFLCVVAKKQQKKKKKKRERKKKERKREKFLYLSGFL